jgi:hypothetical protein
MVTGPDSLLVPELDSNGLAVGTESRTGQFAFDYLIVHDIVTTIDGIPSMMPVVHAWYAADPESELWIAYRRTPLDSLYSEWGSAFSPVYTNTAVLQANTCPGGDPGYLRWRSGGPYANHFALEGTARPTVEVSPLTLFDTCDEMLRSVLASTGARPRDRDPVDSDMVASYLNRTGQIADEIICDDTEAGVVCEAWRCDSAEGCTTLWSWTMPGPAARRILPPPDNPDDCPVFEPGDPSTHPDPLTDNDLMLPCHLEETDDQGYTRLDWWLFALSEGLNATVDPSLRCPTSTRIYLPLILRDS